MDLRVMRRPEDDIVVVLVAGEIDVYTAGAFRSALDELIASGARHLVLDLGNLGFLDSTGLGVLVGRLKSLHALGGWMRIVCASDRLLRVFRITGLDGVFEIHPDVKSALPS